MIDDRVLDETIAELVSGWGNAVGVPLSDTVLDGLRIYGQVSYDRGYCDALMAFRSAFDRLVFEQKASLNEWLIRNKASHADHQAVELDDRRDKNVSTIMNNVCYEGE